LYAHVANIIDDNDKITNLVDPGTSIHTWQPKPSDVLAMETADVIIINGL
jgi:ABC-type Zn uptake system ZnuABC Zn-binding protein ZnuA